jgi:tetrahydromethanopterin S-methyltransferase subunit G
MQAIELTPKNYNQPIRGKNVDIYTKVGKRLFRDIHIYYQIVNIETYLDYLGFDQHENINSEI